MSAQIKSIHAIIKRICTSWWHIAEWTLHLMCRYLNHDALKWLLCLSASSSPWKKSFFKWYRSMDAGLRLIYPPLVWMWVTDHRQKWPESFYCTEVWRPSALPLIICFDFSHLASKVKDGHWTGICPHHVVLLGRFFQSQEMTPLSLGIEPASFRFNGQRTNHNTTVDP